MKTTKSDFLFGFFYKRMYINMWVWEIWLTLQKWENRSKSSEQIKLVIITENEEGINAI